MLYYKIRKLYALAILFLVSTLFTSCGIWRNFTTYFNTYYNARTLFDLTEDAINAQNTDPFIFREEEQPVGQRTANARQQSQQQNYQNINTSPTNSNQSSQQQTLSKNQINQNLTKVIEKCSKILEYDKESSYFDDALFMTGKAFYYQGEYARAQRKFLELAGLPESDYAVENKLWLAKTYLQLRSFDEGLNLLENVKTTALQQNDEDMLKSASITKIGFLVYREEYQAAINECQSFLKVIDDDETAALVWYQLGKIFMKQGDFENALNAYSSVLKYSPSFEIEFESRLQHALLLKQLNKLDESENELNELSNHGKFRNQLDRILLELGKIYYDKNDNESALKTFTEIDSTYRNTPTSGEASFMLGQLYEKKFGVYDSAYKYYNKAASSTASYDVKNDASNFSRAIGKYFTLKSLINTVDKDLLYLSDPTRFMQDSIDYELAYKEYMDAVTSKADSMETIQNEQQNLISTPSRRQSIEQQVKTQMQQDALRDFTKRTYDYKPTLKDLIVQGKVNKPVMPKMNVDSTKNIQGENYYNLANLFLSELEVPDSAFYYYNLALETASDSTIRGPALFALGTYYETENQKEKADSLYQIIYDNYTRDKLYTQAGIKLGKIKADEDTLATTNDPAEPAYLAAENDYYDKKYASAINGLRNIYLNYPGSLFVPKALYFIGLIYEENLDNPDSAAVFYGILSSKEYMGTPYGKAVMPKYFAYKNEKERIEKEKQDEMKKLEKANSDSTALQTDSTPTVSDSSRIKIDSAGVQQKSIRETDKSEAGKIIENIPVIPPAVKSDSTKAEGKINEQLDVIPRSTPEKVQRDTTNGKTKIPE